MASACASGTGDGPTNMLALISLNGTCGPPDISSQENCLTILSAGESSVIPEAHGKHVVDISVRDFWSQKLDGIQAMWAVIHVYWKGYVTPIRPSFYVC